MGVVSEILSFSGIPSHFLQMRTLRPGRHRQAQGSCYQALNTQLWSQGWPSLLIPNHPPHLRSYQYNHRPWPEERGKNGQEKRTGEEGRGWGKEPGVSREVSRGGLAAFREDKNPQRAGHPGRHESNPAKVHTALAWCAQCSAWHNLGGGCVGPSYKAEPPPLIASL